MSDHEGLSLADGGGCGEATEDSFEDLRELFGVERPSDQMIERLQRAFEALGGADAVPAQVSSVACVSSDVPRG